MILDYMKNYRMYNSLVSNLEEGMTFVSTLLDKLEGRYEAEHGIYAMVQIGVTSDIGKDRMETHEKYLDVQMVFEGRETFEWEEASELEAETEYDPETDFKFYTGGGKKILATEGMFYILFPQDAHRCRGMAGKEGEKYRKIVLKLPVETKR